MDTPWGRADSTIEIADGVVAVQTPSHGGLRLSVNRWAQLPADVAATFITSRRADEDIEAPLAVALLGVNPRAHFPWGPAQFVEYAQRIAERYERYAPACRHLPLPSASVSAAATAASVAP